MTVIEQLNAEIERLKAKYRKDMYKSNHEGLASVYKIEAYNELIAHVARHFAKWGAEHLKK